MAPSSSVQASIRQAAQDNRPPTALTVSPGRLASFTWPNTSKEPSSRQYCATRGCGSCPKAMSPCVAVSELICNRELRLVDLHGRGLARVGTTNAISTGPYARSQTWSDYLWSHRDRPDGIAYASRHNPEQICYAVFERPDIRFTATDPTSFASMLPVIKGLLRRYDKILTQPVSLSVRHTARALQRSRGARSRRQPKPRRHRTANRRDRRRRKRSGGRTRRSGLPRPNLQQIQPHLP